MTKDLPQILVPSTLLVTFRGRLIGFRLAERYTPRNVGNLLSGTQHRIRSFWAEIPL